MILVIDNYDSFTYNLVQYLGELGQQVEVRRNDKIDIKGVEDMNPERIVISPGPGNPDQAGITLNVLTAFSRNSTKSMSSLLFLPDILKQHLNRPKNRKYYKSGLIY